MRLQVQRNQHQQVSCTVLGALLECSHSPHAQVRGAAQRKKENGQPKGGTMGAGCRHHRAQSTQLTCRDFKERGVVR